MPEQPAEPHGPKPAQPPEPLEPPEAPEDLKPLEQDQEKLIHRLYGVLEKQIDDIESQPVANDPERAARALGSLVRTLEKILELTQPLNSSADPSQEIAENTNSAEEIRAELERRFDRLVASK